MNHRKLITTVGLMALGASAWSGAMAASLPAAHQACEEAIVGELGDGRLRTNVLQNSRQNGVGYHWINVRHRATGAGESERYRVRCETREGGAVASIELDEGKWKKTTPNRAPRAVD